MIHCAAVRGAGSGSGSVMCVIRRCEEASPVPPLGAQPPPPAADKIQDHIVFRLDPDLVILCKWYCSIGI